MKALVSVLIRVFAVTFYSSHTTFFLVAGGLCFGFLSGVEHRALAQLFVSSHLLLLIPASLWALYTINVIRYNKTVLSKPQNAFVFHILLVSPLLQVITLSIALIIQLLPIILYAAFLSVTAIQQSRFSSMPLIILSVIMIVGIPLLILLRGIRQGSPEVSISSIRKWIDNHFKRPFFQFYLGWLMRKHFWTIVAAKAFSCLQLLAILYLYKTDAYDIRLLALGITLGAPVNLQLIFQIHHFENVFFTIYRNLPLHFWKRLYYVTLVFIIVNLPEIGLLVRQFPDQLSTAELPYTIMYMVSLSIVAYALLFILPSDIDRYIRNMFYLTIMTVVLILFKTPVILLASGFSLLGGYIVYTRFYTFEYAGEQPHKLR